MKNLAKYLLILCVGLTFTACMESNNNDDPIANNTFFDIVTFIGNPQSNNNNAVFQFQQENDSRLTTLFANDFAIDTTITKKSTRILLCYTPQTGMHNIDDIISVKSASKIFNDSIRTGDVNKLPDLEYNPIFVNTIWRSGSYININCGLTYSFEPIGFMLMVDASTIDNPMPDVYLSYQKGNDHESGFKNFYASIDIANLWNRPTCSGFTLHVNDSNFGNNKITFKKTTLTPMY